MCRRSDTHSIASKVYGSTGSGNWSCVENHFSWKSSQFQLRSLVFPSCSNLIRRTAIGIVKCDQGIVRSEWERNKAWFGDGCVMFDSQLWQIGQLCILVPKNKAGIFAD